MLVQLNVKLEAGFHDSWEDDGGFHRKQAIV